MHLFIQGEIGIGKSTLLRQALKQRGLTPPGLATQRLLKNGSTVGFRALIIDGEPPPVQTEYSPDMEGVFLLKGQGNAAILAEALNRVEQGLREQPCPLLLLDEIGGIELTNAVFMESLLRILTSGTPCIGVLKSAANLGHTLKTGQPEGEYGRQHKALVGLLKEQGQLLTLRKDNREEIWQQVSSYLAMSFSI